MIWCLSNARSRDLHFGISFVALRALVREIFFFCALILFCSKLSIKSFGILELFYECIEQIMNASTYPIRILQSEFWWCGQLTNLPGFDWLQLSGLRFAFYNDIPDLQRYDGGVTHSRFSVSFLTSISFQSDHSSTAFDPTSI